MINNWYERKLKFKAWDDINNKMHHNVYFDHKYIFTSDEKFENSIIRRLDDNLILQYTGEVDKHENEIYDQDIVKWDDGEEIIQMIVEWSQGGFVFLIINHPYKSWKEIDMEVADEVQIIGNAFENPELIKRYK
jgi:uncharacterized phage protein (TIGR01671 family)